ncbi:hypothetical protein D6158_03940 [Nocardia seriolae]|nr:hypothetical protein C6575_03335 [Nocardia seriolae]RLP33166.1 hypothetical protein D6158_03940 [Nocardia seriolae]
MPRPRGAFHRDRGRPRRHRPRLARRRGRRRCARNGIGPSPSRRARRIPRGAVRFARSCRTVQRASAGW